MRKHRILVVEDELIIGMHIASTLGRFGYDVIGVAPSGEDAIAMAEELDPDLILMDIVMPGGMDGIDAARILKNTLDLPVVYLTGNADISTVTRARETNPYGYVLKPVNPQDLFSTLDTALHRHELEKKLRDSEEKLRRLTDSMTDMVSQVDRENHVTYASPSHTKVMGYPVEEILGHMPMEMVHPDDRVMVQEQYLKGIKDHIDISIEYRCLHKDGHYVWLETVISFIYTRDGKFDGAVFSSRDITERKRVEALHRESEEWYDTLFSRSHDCIYLHDFAGNFLEANDSALTLLGFSREEIQTLSFQSLLSEDQYPGAVEALQEILTIGFQKEKKRYWLRAKNNDTKYVDALGMMVYRDGNPHAILGIAHDVTEQILSEEALRESEAKYRLITDMMSDVVWTLDMDLTFSYISPSVNRVLGYTPDGLEGISVKLVVPPDVYSLIEGRLEREVRSEEEGNPDPDRVVVLELPALHKNGSPVWTETVVKAIRDSGGGFIGLHGVSRDISVRRRTEEALIASEEKYRALVESTDTGYVIVDPGGCVMDANPEYVRLTGHADISDILGRSVVEWTADHHRIKNEEAVRRCFEQGFIRGLEIDYIDSKGNIIPIEINATLTGSGPDTRIHTLCRDISRRRQAEEELLKNKERIHASLREKEMLLREVHHRVKNNFQVITSLMSLQASAIKNPDLRKSFVDAQSRIRSMSLIHEKFYQSDDLSRLDFASYVNTIVYELYSTFANSSMNIKPLVDMGDIRLNVDQAIPCGLIINELLTNSFKYAFPAGWKGNAEIHVSIHESDGVIEMVIRDTGVGLPESVDINTTQSLGISLVPLLVRQLDGTVVLERSQGTRYIISFPAK